MESNYNLAVRHLWIPEMLFAADQALTGGKDYCLIWEVFAAGIRQMLQLVTQILVMIR
jgi:hypothetical protein